MLKRLFDLIMSLIGLLILLPLFLLISIGIILTSKGGVIFGHKRVGLNGVDFTVYKFRTMMLDDGQRIQITLGNDDPRITSFGKSLRRYKLDELPQLFNVLIGNMSLVGPRPEVRKYVDGYTEEQLVVLSVKPGITDYASLEYVNEGELLGKAEDPEKEYIEVVLPIKLDLAIRYVKERGFFTDLSIIIRTLWRIIT